MLTSRSQNKATAFNPDLNFQYSDIVVPLGVDVYGLKEADFSQIGLKRNAFPLNQRMPATFSSVVTIANAHIAAPFAAMRKPDGTKGILIVYNTSNLVRESLNNDQLSALHKALTPVTSDVKEATLSDPEFVNKVDEIKNAYDMSVGQLSAFMSALMSTNADFNAFISSWEVVEPENRTNKASTTFNVDTLAKMGFNDWLVLKTRMGDIPETIKFSVNVIDFIKLASVDLDRNMIISHPLIADLYNKIAAQKAVKSIKIPESLDFLQQPDQKLEKLHMRYYWWLEDDEAAQGIIIGSKVTVKVVAVGNKVEPIIPEDATMEQKREQRLVQAEPETQKIGENIYYSNIGWVPTGVQGGGRTHYTASPMNSGMVKMPFLRQFAFYMYSRAQAAQAREEENHMFSMGRLHVAVQRQYYDSTEIILAEDFKYDHPNESIIKAFFDSFNKPEIWRLLEHAIAISFLRSGHHATAYNMYNILSRIFGSLGINVNMDFIQAYLRSYVYHGGHVGSTRVQILQSWAKASTNEFIGSIAYRLHPAPPMFATYTNLELYVDQLATIGFFEYMNKTSEYEAFKSAMASIKKKMHFAAPYSEYLYGQSVADPVAEKSIAIRVAAYATAIAAVMPNSTLLDSPALQKLVAQTSDNTISANLLIEAYVTAYRSFHRRIVERRLESKVSGGVLKGPIQ